MYSSFRLVLECLIIYFFFVETRGPILEEISVLFDGEDSAGNIAKAQANEKADYESNQVESI